MTRPRKFAPKTVESQSRTNPRAPFERWLVTGGAGFLGQSLVRRLLAEQKRVRVLDGNPSEAFAAHPHLEYFQGDVRDAALVDRACEGVDVVVHAAAALPIHRSKKFIWDVNVNGMKNVLEASLKNGVKAVVFTSSTAVYGLPKHHPILETSPMKPVGPYGASKVEAERLCRAYRQRGLRVGILRAKTFIGPGRLGVFEILFDWIDRGKRIPLIGPGHNRYQLLDVDDLIDAILLCAERPEGNDDFNLGALEFGTLREDLTALFQEAGTGARFRPLPRRTAKAILFLLEKTQLSPLTRWHYATMDKESYVDISKAQRQLGWQPQRSNREAMVAAYRWYHAHKGEFAGRTGTTHTVPWNQRVLKLLRKVS